MLLYARWAEEDVARFLTELGPRRQDALGGVRRWLDALDVDPIRLRQLGIKGKKKLTEQLDAYHWLWRIAEPMERLDLVSRVRQLIAVTDEPGYHDMGLVGEQEFRENSTSYLRAAMLIDRMGLDTDLYRAEIDKVVPLLNERMASRGFAQRLAFHNYYEYLDIPSPFTQDVTTAGGVIGHRIHPHKLSRDEVYVLAHEIFARFEPRPVVDGDPFDADTMAYLRHALEFQTTWYLTVQTVDLVAELLACMRLLRFEDHPAYHAGLEFLLTSQNPDGSWGDQVLAQEQFGDLGVVRIILHTTLVALRALVVCWDR